MSTNRSAAWWRETCSSCRTGASLRQGGVSRRHAIRVISARPANHPKRVMTTHLAVAEAPAQHGHGALDRAGAARGGIPDHRRDEARPAASEDGGGTDVMGRVEEMQAQLVLSTKIARTYWTCVPASAKRAAARRARASTSAISIDAGVLPPRGTSSWPRVPSQLAATGRDEWRLPRSETKPADANTSASICRNDSERYDEHRAHLGGHLSSLPSDAMNCACHVARPRPPTRPRERASLRRRGRRRRGRSRRP
jgi:hypothetical protein